MELIIGFKGRPDRPRPWVSGYFLIKKPSKVTVMDPLGSYPAFTVGFLWYWRRAKYGKVLYPGRRWLEAHGEAY